MIKKSRVEFCLTRRQIIGGIASIPIATIFTPTKVFAAPKDIEKFIYASSILCGIAMDKTFVELAERIWTILTKDATKRDMAQWRRLIDEISKLPPSSDSKRIKKRLRYMGPRVFEKAQLLAKVWYTGRIKRTNGTPKGTFQVIDYDNALVWLACTFTKPPVTCGGHFGYWQHPYTRGV
jgi:hypothetical protein